MDKNDLKNLLVFLNRVDLKGGEAMAMAVLLQKIEAMFKDAPEEELEAKKK